MVTVQVARATTPTSRARHAPLSPTSSKASSSEPGAQSFSSPSSSSSTKKRSSNVFWIKLNFTVKAARLRTLKRQKYQHLQEETLLKARGLLKNWEDGPVLLIEDLYRQAAGERGVQELMNYTPEALALRFSLRNDPRVLRVAKELWSIDTGPRDALGCIDQRGYTALFHRIAKSIDAVFPSKRRRKLEKTIHDDWTHDSKGEAHMSFADFFDSAFELADLWCETIESDEYVTFLEKVRDRISEPPRQSSAGIAMRVLRPIKKVRPLRDEEVSSESPTSSSSASASSSSEQEDETEVCPTKMDDIGSSSQVHRFLTAKNLMETTTRNPHLLTRKINSATGALGSQTLRASSTAIGTARGIASRLSLEAARQRQSRSGIVGSSIRFETDYDAATVISGRGSASSTDLSALVEGTAFQPIGGAPTSSSTSYPQSMVAATDSLEKRRSAPSSSKVITTDVVAEARPRTPTIAIHVVDSGINGIFNSSSSSAATGAASPGAYAPAALGGTFSTGRSPMFAPGTRSAIMNLARVNKKYGNGGAANALIGAGFREVVFNAMQSSTRGPSSNGCPDATMAAVAPNERRHDGGSHMNAVVGAQLQTESGLTASPSTPSRSATQSSHADGSLLVASTPFGRHQECSCMDSVVDARLQADTISLSTRSYAASPSRDASDSLLTAVLNPATTAPVDYGGNNNSVDFSASYTMTSYASDPRIATASFLLPHTASAADTRLTPASTRSKYKANTANSDGDDSSAPPFCSYVAATTAAATTLGGRIQRCVPWDTYPDDVEYLSRDWQSLSLAESGDGEAVSSLVVSSDINGVTQQLQSPRPATKSTTLHGGGITKSTRVDMDLLLRVTSLETVPFPGSTANPISTTQQQLHHSVSAPDASFSSEPLDIGMQHVLLHPPPAELGLSHTAPSQSSPPRKSLTPTRSRKSREINGVTLAGLAMRGERATATPAAGKGSPNRALAPLLRVCDGDSKRPPSPLFRMDKLTLPQPHVATLDGLNDQDGVKMSPERDDITILLNAHRELILRPTRKEDDIVANAHHPTRSEMMARRYRYTFGRVKHP
ncbi:hypothetical protein FI667_g6810, partial [Globisporangium splendens]